MKAFESTAICCSSANFLELKGLVRYVLYDFDPPRQVGVDRGDKCYQMEHLSDPSLKQSDNILVKIW